MTQLTAPTTTDTAKMTKLTTVVIMTEATLLARLGLVVSLLATCWAPAIGGCPSPCSCSSPGDGDLRVTCPPGLTAFPAGLEVATRSLTMTGRSASGAGSRSHVPRLSRADLTPLGQLRDLAMPFVGLEEIEDGSLAAVPHLQRLSLQDNLLHKVSSATFSGLANLSYLDLTSNPGCVIEGDDVFADLTSLTSLFLGEMGLREARASWFRTLRVLESLDLHGNEIEALESDFLLGVTTLKTLELTGNRLQGLAPSASATYLAVPHLYLADNHWHCNCEVAWFKQLRVPRRHSADLTVCATPGELTLRDVTAVPDSELHCVPPTITCEGLYEVREGSGITVTCEAEGDPFPVVTWLSPSRHVIDVTKPGYFYTSRRKVNTSSLAFASFADHHGQWTAVANSTQGSDVAHFVVYVITTTTSTTSIATSVTRTVTPTTLKKSELEPVKVDSGTAPAAPADASNLWFYVALAAFGVTALALTSLILVAAVKIRKSRRQVGAEDRLTRGRRRSSVLTLSGADHDTEVTDLAGKARLPEGRGNHDLWC